MFDLFVPVFAFFIADDIMIGIAIASLVASAASTAYGITSSIQAAKAQSEMQQVQAKMQAQNLRQQADQEEQSQLQRSMIERRQNARRLAAAETQYAASGVTLEGTPTLALEQMSEEQELEITMQEAASGQKRQLWLADAANVETMGIAGADMTERAGYINGIGQGLSGVADLGFKSYALGSSDAFKTKDATPKTPKANVAMNYNANNQSFMV